MKVSFFTQACIRQAALALTIFTFLGEAVQADSFDRMISPLSNPVNFEDPRIRSELRPLFMHHEMDDEFVTGGGDVQLYALQARFAVSDDLAIIATKDGFIDFNPKALPDQTGWANLGIGAKYALYQDSASGTILTGGLRYEIPSGNTDVFQGTGDGQFNPFISYGQNMGMFNLILGTGVRVPIDGADSTFYDADLHIDMNIEDVFFPTFEVNVVHVLDAGRRLPIPDEGQDLFNFGSIDSDGETMVTAAAGARFRVCDTIDLGAYYQFPLATGAGTRVTDWRVGADLIYSFDL